MADNCRALEEYLRRVLLVVMDGMGLNPSRFGNAVALAKTPNLKFLEKNSLFTTLQAHGTAVGLPSDDDIGNSEVGHNAIGAGRIYDQGAKLVNKAIETGSLYEGNVWKEMMASLKRTNGTLHFIGLLSDGNVHSHEEHLFALIRQAKTEGVRRVRVHVLFDGRDVGEKTAEIYTDRLENVLAEVRNAHFDAAVASGGGRMNVTMDRYEADWRIVERGWNAHVRGIAPQTFSSLKEAVAHFRRDPALTDQYFPPFVICRDGKPVGPIVDGDAVIFYNFRGDRAIEICRAFTEDHFDKFDRGKIPDIFFAGMMEYDGDLHIPKRYLVPPPHIDHTLGEYLSGFGARQFACSETQKYGHVTYFFNGNRSGKFNDPLEEYVEFPSDKIPFDQKPEMKAKEITDITIDHLERASFDFGRINYANGDMVGHTGNLEAAVFAVEVVDTQVGRLIAEAKKTNTILVVTADHGNSDEMFDAKEKDFPNWESLPPAQRPKPKTAHTRNPVPFYIYDPSGKLPFTLANVQKRTLGNIANTILDLMGLPKRSIYLPSLVAKPASFNTSLLD